MSIFATVTLVMLSFILTEKSDIKSHENNSPYLQNPNHTITREAFNTWTSEWLNNSRTFIRSNSIRAFTMPAKNISDVLVQNPASVRFYFGLDASTNPSTPHLIAVGINASGQDLGVFYNMSTPCPPTCENIEFSPRGGDEQGELIPNTISLETFINWNNAWNLNGRTFLEQNTVQYFTLPMSGLVLLKDQNAAEVRFYLGLDTSVNPNKIHLSMVGADKNGIDNLSVIYDNSSPCPPVCTN
ncbi:MAG: hypothetical protein IPM42_01895 [Saprospiraceae bacterium]|nr:hypothetical protein [Saprospiraceae bacterium]